MDLRLTGNETFGAWIKRRRRALDLTQAELAHRAACALITIQKLEAGHRRPSRQVAGTLADCLAIPDEQRQSFVTAARAPISAKDAAT